MLKKELRAYLQEKKELLFRDSLLSFIKTKNCDFDVIISSYGPIWTHLVAKTIKQKHSKAFWVADFRDPYARDIDTPKAFRRHRDFVKKECELADVISVVVPGMPVYAAQGQKVITLPNGFDLQEKMAAIRPDRFRIVYTGRLYAGRQNIQPLFRAICELVEENFLFEKDLVIEYAGSTKELFWEQAKNEKVAQYVHLQGELPRNDALRMQSEAAILLQAGWNTKREHIGWTGKTFEYMMMEKPIVYLVTGEEPYSIPGEYMEKLGGVCYEQSRHKETYPLMKRYLLEKYQEWSKTGNVTIQRDEAYVEQYSYENIAEQVWKLISKKAKKA